VTARSSLAAGLAGLLVALVMRHLGAPPWHQIAASAVAGVLFGALVMDR
jgi:hypothetical protein